ncbi:cytochrome P450 6B6-like [Aricia agestis]|uniref:cytochrome P450 6B6-like n=1 Tax=Aricia agestis TaxID=91739 RepID=UPI001C20C282|nr:cytochrome P450 6B6-like [Aricia agestis]
MLVLYFFAIVAVLLIYYFRHKNNYWKNKGLPGPKPILLFGNYKNAALRRENSAETLRNIYNEFRNVPLIGMYRMTSPCILVTDLDVIKNIMIKDFDKFQDRGVEFSKEGLGANLFHADGETWRVLRNRFTPMFTTSKLKNMVYLIEQKSDIIMRYLDDITTGTEEQDITKIIRRYTCSTIASCAFGLEFDTISESLMAVLLKIDKLTLTCNPFHEIDMMFPGVLKKTNISLFPRDVSSFFDRMVSNVINERDGKPSTRNDFMDIILEMREQKDITYRQNNKGNGEDDLKLTLTDGVIAAQAFVIYIAGYETSATILTYLVYELAMNPKIQNKLLEEIDEVMNRNKDEITYDSVCNNPYMEKVFNEVYRKYPLVPIFRKSNCDYKVPGMDFTIEKDTVIMIPTLGIHYDEKYYPDPKKFDPERFSPENEQNRHSCAYLPYGVGPRNCIGIRFGKLQTRVFAMKFFRKYRVEPSPKTGNLEFDPNRLLVSPLGGIYVNIVPRNVKAQ